MINTIEILTAPDLFDDEVQRKEHLFNILEIGLIERMAKQDSPPFLVDAVTYPISGQPVIPTLVNVLWTLYHESDCAINQKNRTVWTRFRIFPRKPVDVAELVGVMIELLDLVQLDVLAEHRPVSDEEEAAYQILMALAGYYAFKHRIPVLPSS